MKLSDQIREYAGRQYIDPVRQGAGTTVKIKSGDVVKGLGLKNRTPSVCEVLRSHPFQEQYGLKLIGEQGPPSGMSTTVVFTYKIMDRSRPAGKKDFKSIRGIAKDVFKSLGGGEAFIRRERENFYGKNDPHRQGRRG